MSDPTDDELREWWKGTHWSDPKPSDFGALRLAFLAGRASVTQPSREEIAEAIWKTRHSGTRWATFTNSNDASKMNVARGVRAEADAVLALLGVVPSTGNKETP